MVFAHILSSSHASLLHPRLPAFIKAWFGKCIAVQVVC